MRKLNEIKATQAAASLIEKEGGLINYMKLIKLLYIADRKALQEAHTSITDDNYVSMDRGPVLSQIYNLIQEQPEPGTVRFWSRFIAREDYSLRLLTSPGKEQLSRYEDEVLTAVYAEFGSLNQWQLVAEVHKFPEWKDPHGSMIPIEIKEILQAGGVSSEAAEQIQVDLEHSNYVMSLF